MNATKATKTAPEKDHRTRTHRFTSMPVKDILKLRMSDLDVKNVDLATSLGYKMPNVIAMMKSGSMRMPPSKAIDCARILKLDPVFLLGKLIAESDAELWSVISQAMGKRMVSDNEMELINYLRQELDGHDVKLAEEEDFIRAVAPVVKAIAKREDAGKTAALERLEREKEKTE